MRLSTDYSNLLIQSDKTKTNGQNSIKVSVGLPPLSLSSLAPINSASAADHLINLQPESVKCAIQDIQAIKPISITDLTG